MRRRLALRSEIFRRLHQAGPENLLPEAIDRDARGQRIGGIDNPLSEAEPVARQRCGHGRQHGGYRRRDLLARLIVLAAEQHIRHRRAAGLLVHDQSHGGATANGATLGFERRNRIRKLHIAAVGAVQIVHQQRLAFGGR